MRRSVFLVLTCLLALATGSALLYAAATVAMPAPDVAPRSVPPDAAANTALVRRFYAAANQTLRTGDPAPLHGLVAADFVSHANRPGLPASRAGLGEYLVGLGETFPAMRLTAVDLVAEGDKVMARVRVDGVEGGRFLGLPLTDELAAWGPIDVFQVVAGTIVEHWASRDGAALLRPLSQAPLSLPAADGASLRVERLTYAPGATIPVRRHAQRRLVFLEAGSLRVEVAGGAVLERSFVGADRGERETFPAAGSVELRPGDLLDLAVASVYVARNDGPVPAVSIDLTILPTLPRTPLSDGLDSTTGADGVTAHRLATASVPLTTEPITIAVGQAILAPNAALPAHTVTGPVVVYVADGVLGTVSPIVADRPERVRRPLTPETRFGRGDTALVGAGTIGPLRNAGAALLRLVLLTITPAPSDAMVADAT